MTEWPSRNQQAPAYWDEQLKAYVDETPAREASTPGSDFSDLLATREAALATEIGTETDDKITVASAAVLGDANEYTDAQIEAALTRVAQPLDLLHARLAKASSGPVRAVMLGSSTPAGTGASEPSRRMTNVLASLIQRVCPSGVTLWEPPTILGTDVAYAANLPGFHMVNAAIGGTTSADYVPAGTITQITTWQPHVVFHMIGANDYRFDSPTPSQAQANITARMASIDAVLTVPAVHVVCGTYAMPVETSPVYPWSQYLAAMQAAAEAHPRGIWVDASLPFVQAQASGPSAPDPLDLIAADGVHATDAGHALLAREIARLLNVPESPAVASLLPQAYDRFARKTLGATECGQAWAQQSTAVHVPNGTYLTVTTAGNAVIETGFSDVDVSAVCTVATGSVSGVIAKSNDANTRIGWYFQPATNEIQLFQGTTNLAAYAVPGGLVANREYFLRLRVVGAEVLGYLDGALVLTHTLASPGSYGTYTLHGVRASATSGSPKWRNFAARAA